MFSWPAARHPPTPGQVRGSATTGPLESAKTLCWIPIRRPLPAHRRESMTEYAIASTLSTVWRVRRVPARCRRTRKARCSSAPHRLESVNDALIVASRDEEKVRAVGDQRKHQAERRRGELEKKHEEQAGGISRPASHRGVGE